MTTRAAAARRELVARRHRSLAAAGVAVCVALNLWVAAAGASGTDLTSRPPHQPSTRPTTTTDDSALAGTAPSAPLPSSTGDAGATTGGPRSAAAGSTDAAPTPGPTTTPRVVQRGDGKFTVLSVPAGAVQETPKTGRTVRYTIETEGGLGIDPTAYASTVAHVLSDPRGWQTRDKVRFVNVKPADAKHGTRIDIRVTLASPDTTDRLCAPLQTRGQVSCHANGRAVLNAKRWLLGVPEAYGKDVATYRIYQINHEVGHGIGHGHATCPGKGKPAPVMMQQSYGLDGCTGWPWPTPKPA